jgi:hypothetical protein
MNDQIDQNTRCAWAGGTSYYYASFPEFCDNRQFYVILLWVMPKFKIRNKFIHPMIYLGRIIHIGVVLKRNSQRFF